MKYVMPNKKTQLLRAGTLLAIVTQSLALTSCSLKSNGESTHLSIPLPGAQLSYLKPLTSWISLAWASTTTTTNLDIAPSALSDFDCYMVNVTAPDIAHDPRVSCTDSDAPSILGGFVPAGNSSIDLDVPAGPSRTIKIVGVRSLVGCPNINDMLNGGAIQFDGNIGHMYQIGAATTDIFADASVNIHVTYDGSAPIEAFNNCSQNGHGPSGLHLWSAWASSGPGTVKASKVVGSSLYLGGSFDMIGPTTDSAVQISQSNGALLSQNFAHMGNNVRCAAPDMHGGLYIGGNITNVNGVTYNNLVHLNSDGSVDPAFLNLKLLKSGMPNLAYAYSCVFDGTNLYVGGYFDSVYNGVTTLPVMGLVSIRVADLSLSTVGGTNAPGGSSQVNALTYIPATTKLIVGGNGLTAGTGGTYNAILAYNTTTNTIDTAFAANVSSQFSASNIINSISYDGVGALYFGGSFTLTGYNNAAKVTMNTESLDGSWSTSALVSTTVNAIAATSTHIYVAGTQSLPFIHRMAATNGSLETDLLTGMTLGGGDTVNSLAISTDGTQLFAGGQFTMHLSNGTNWHRGLISVTGYDSAVPAVSTSFAADINKYTAAYVLAPMPSGSLFVGGNFRSIGGMLSNNLGAIDLTTGQALGWGPDLSLDITGVNAIASDGTFVYAGHTTSTVPTVSQFPTTLGRVSPIWQVPTGSAGDQVNALAVDSAHVYVGGNFTQLHATAGFNSLGRISLAGVVDSAWLPTIKQTGVPGTINALAFEPASTTATPPIYAAGTFDTVLTTTCYGVAAIDTTTGSLSAFWTDPGFTSGSHALAFTGTGTLLADYNNMTVRKLNAVTGGATEGDINVSGDIYGIYAIATDANTVYVGGHVASGSAAAAYDLNALTPIGSFVANIKNSDYVYTLGFTADANLIVGGSFQQVNIGDVYPGGEISPGVALLNPTTGLLY